MKDAFQQDLESRSDVQNYHVENDKIVCPLTELLRSEEIRSNQDPLSAPGGLSIGVNFHRSTEKGSRSLKTEVTRLALGT